VRKIPFRVFSSNKLPLVATDGRRLALVELEVEFPSSQETQDLIKLMDDKGNILNVLGRVCKSSFS
jgi:DNA polymerase-3 subunit beta